MKKITAAFSSPFVVASVLFCSAAFMACSSDDNKPTVTENGKVISSIEIDGDDGLKPNETRNYTATVKYSDGSANNITSNADSIWNTSDAATVTITKTGAVTAIKAGIVNISITYKEIKESKKIIVGL